MKGKGGKLGELRAICKKAQPGPWEWRSPENKDGSDIVYYEPYTDGSPGKGSKYALISRDSGVYGPDVATCEFIMAFNPELVAKLLKVAEAADSLLGEDDALEAISQWSAAFILKDALAAIEEP